MTSYTSTEEKPLKQNFGDNKEVLVSTREASIFSTSTTASCLTLVDDQNPNNTFRPGSILSINAQGVGVIRLPIPSSELEIEVLRQDGSLAYTSQRAKRCSGDATLSHAKLGEMVSTQYRFGPNREPVLKLLQGKSDPEAPAMSVKGRWTSRATTFVDANTGRAFTWSYAKTKDAAGKKVNIIVLRQHDEQGEHKEGEGKILAQLLRGAETRTPGTTSCRAGNGGQLVLDQDAASVLDEALIVATCLVMLKKELDRRRVMQMAIIAGAVSGGS